MKGKIDFINSILLSAILISTILLIIYALIWLPKIGESVVHINNAQCLESYYNQNQPPLGACGYDFS